MKDIEGGAVVIQGGGVVLVTRMTATMRVGRQVPARPLPDGVARRGGHEKLGFGSKGPCIAKRVERHR
jgi:hypothetical protein